MRLWAQIGRFTEVSHVYPNARLFGEFRALRAGSDRFLYVKVRRLPRLQSLRLFSDLSVAKTHRFWTGTDQATT
jgi:hypothetical protein